MEVAVGPFDASRAARLAAYSAVSTSLALCSDRDLRDLVDTAEPMGSGFGGTSALLEVDGTPVFVKRLPLTDLERQPYNVRSTANLFGLPAFCHPGLGVPGSPGWGAWRELAVHTMTTNWVLAQDYEGFPLMYDWRVLPHTGQALPEELADVGTAAAGSDSGQPTGPTSEFALVPVVIRHDRHAVARVRVSVRLRSS